MSLNSSDKPLPTYREVQPGHENLFTKTMRRVLARKSASTQIPTNEQGLITWQEGEVPLIEVARIIREQGSVIAPNLYAHYEAAFDTPPDLEGRIEDIENKVQLFQPNDGSRYGRRDIDVFIVPPTVTETGYALGKHPKIKFIYGNKTGEWSYETAFVHGGHEDGGATEVNYANEVEAKREGISLWNVRVKMADMERALGKYLNPPEPTQNQTQALHQPPPLIPGK